MGIVDLTFRSSIAPPVQVDALGAAAPSQEPQGIGARIGTALLAYMRPTVTVATPLGSTTSAPWGPAPAEWSAAPLLGLLLVVVGVPFALGWLLARGTRE